MVANKGYKVLFLPNVIFKGSSRVTDGEMNAPTFTVHSYDTLKHIWRKYNKWHTLVSMGTSDQSIYYWLCEVVAL